MVQKILIRNSRPFIKRLKQAAKYLYRKRGGERAWRLRHNKVAATNPALFQSSNIEVEKEHRKLWKPFRRRVNPDTFRLCGNLSGTYDPRIIPEEIFVIDIEPSLGYGGRASLQLNKSLYELYYPEGIFPKSYLHRMDGRYFDSGLNEITEEQAFKIAGSLPYPVIAKPGMDQFGGEGVRMLLHTEELKKALVSRPNIVVQERVIQNSWFARFHPSSVNTVRVYLYRSVKDDRVHLLSVDVTIGRSKTFVNNETAGGMYVGAGDDGRLVGYAVDKWGTKYSVHPDSGESFTGQIPFYDQMIQRSYQLAFRTFSTRIMGLDLYLDETGNWKALEINTTSHSIRSAQYFGRPFFGDFTHEIIDYCIENHWALRV